MNKNIAKESVTISFPFEIYNNGEFLDNAILERTFDENELKKISMSLIIALFLSVGVYTVTLAQHQDMQNNQEQMKQYFDETIKTLNVINDKNHR